jgi:cob(I)alamin adenosyltransferase
MKLYTRKGDGGSTWLFDGREVRKDDPRVVAYGTMDELNAVLGWAACACGDAGLTDRLVAVQRDLFRIGADLATPSDDAAVRAALPVLEANRIGQIERWIDESTNATPPLRAFILPGGSEAAGRLHIARTVCRRAEREVVHLASVTAVNPDVLRYLNRLGDLLFAWARLANAAAGVADVPWAGRGASAGDTERDAD